MQSEHFYLAQNMLVIMCGLIAHTIGGFTGVILSLPLSFIGMRILTRNMNPLQTDAERVLNSLNNKDLHEIVSRFISAFILGISAGVLVHQGMRTPLSPMLGGITACMLFLAAARKIKP